MLSSYSQTLSDHALNISTITNNLLNVFIDWRVYFECQYILLIHLPGRKRNVLGFEQIVQPNQMLELVLLSHECIIPEPNKIEYFSLYLYPIVGVPG